MSNGRSLLRGVFYYLVSILKGASSTYDGQTFRMLQKSIFGIVGLFQSFENWKQLQYNQLELFPEAELHVAIFHTDSSVKLSYKKSQKLCHISALLNIDQGKEL